ncbi:MAG TPA: hypothetical protein VF631_10910 [Allosphingosinicella sp.]|uniref:hypothetical protein n=1 Tax=Allosphingosinicella sp. TaxID=2823234 RepID=UPI002F2A194E
MPYETRSQKRERQSREEENSQRRLRDSIEQAKRLLDRAEALILRGRDHGIASAARTVTSDAS